MTLSLWILISFMPKAFWETSLWGVLGEALGYFFFGGAVFNSLHLILHHLLNDFPSCPYTFVQLRTYCLRIKKESYLQY